jgi:hypothetical protein
MKSNEIVVLRLTISHGRLCESVGQLQISNPHRNMVVGMISVLAHIDTLLPRGGEQEEVARRLLDALLTHAPSPKGQQNVGLEITSCKDAEQILTLAERYRTCLILPSERQPCDLCSLNL